MHLSGTGYREALLQMPPDERDALLKGLWYGSKLKGAYYVNEMQKLRAEGRIRSVPYTPGVPVHTYWDLGMNDTTAIWFMQYVSNETRMVGATTGIVNGEEKVIAPATSTFEVALSQALFEKLKVVKNLGIKAKLDTTAATPKIYTDYKLGFDVKARVKVTAKPVK